MKMKRIAALEIPSQKIFISAVLSFLDAVADHHPNLEYSRYNRLRYVVGEILANRVENAYPGTVGPLKVEVFLGDDCCEVSVKDKGVPTWTDFSYDGDTNFRDTKKLRNYLLELFTDDIGMEQLGKNGPQVLNITEENEQCRQDKPHADIE